MCCHEVVHSLLQARLVPEPLVPRILPGTLELWVVWDRSDDVGGRRGLAAAASQETKHTVHLGWRSRFAKAWGWIVVLLCQYLLWHRLWWCSVAQPLHLCTNPEAPVRGRGDIGVTLCSISLQSVKDSTSHWILSYKVIECKLMNHESLWTWCLSCRTGMQVLN